MEINTVIRNYLTARKELLEAVKSNNQLSGNDNIIGSRIGEYIAISYYRLVKKIEVQKVLSPSNPGYDLNYIQDGIQKRVSVKLISAENKRGTTTPLKKSWDEFLLIELDMDYKVLKLGTCSKINFDKIQKQFKYSATPMVKRTMLGSKGMIVKSGGELATATEIEKINEYVFGQNK